MFSCLNRCFFFYIFFLRSVFSLSRLQEVTLFRRSRSHKEKKNSAKKIFWRTARNSGGARKVAPRSQSSAQRANVFFFIFYFFPTDCSFDSCDGIHRKGATPRSVHYVKKFYCDVNYVKYVKYLFKYPVICLKSQEPFPSSLEGSSYWKPTVFLLQIFFGSTNLCHEILYEDHCIIIRFPGICNMH